MSLIFDFVEKYIRCGAAAFGRCGAAAFGRSTVERVGVEFFVHRWLTQVESKCHFLLYLNYLNFFCQFFFRKRFFVHTIL